MYDGFYLLNLSLCGFKNIKNTIHLDFYKKTVDKNFDPAKYKVKAIYGENGTGKSAIVTAVQLLKSLVTDRQYLYRRENQEFLTGVINKELNSASIDCEYYYKMAEGCYVGQYHISIEKKSGGLFEISNESLSYKNAAYMNSNYKNVFQVRDGEIIFLDLTDTTAEYVIDKTKNLLKNESFILSMFKNGLNNENFEPNVINIIYCLFFALQLNIYMDVEDQHTLQTVRKYKDNNLDSFENYSKFMSAIDKHISYYEFGNSNKISKKDYSAYESKVNRLCKFLKIFKPDILKIDIDKKEDVDFYICKMALNYGKYSIDIGLESTGIRKLIRLFDFFSHASNGEIVFIDELDSNINDVYFCKLIEYFMFYGKGQLCFTTHNLDPMTVLKDNKYSINFLSGNNTIYSWVSRGNATPDNYYRNGLIEDIPFNIDASDFIGIFEEE